MRTTSMSYGQRTRRTKALLVAASLTVAATGVGIAGAGVAFAQSPAKSPVAVVKHRTNSVHPSSHDHGESKSTELRERSGSKDPASTDRASKELTRDR